MTSHMDGVRREMNELTGIVQAIERGIIGMGDSAREVNRTAETVLELAKDTHRIYRPVAVVGNGAFCPGFVD